MTDRFGRAYRLTIGEPKILKPARLEVEDLTTSISKGTLLFDYIKAPAEYGGDGFKEFSGYQIKTDISYGKTNTTVGNTSKIVIQNLPKESRDFIKQGHSVILEAGYESDGDGLPRIYTGEIISKHVITSGIMETTTLTVGQFFTVARQLKVSLSFPPQTSYYDTLQGVITKFKEGGFTFGSAKFIEAVRPSLEAIVFKGGWSVEGNAFSVIQELAKRINWRYYALNNVIYLEPKDDKLTPARITYFVSSDNFKEPPRIKESKAKSGVVLGSGKSTGYIFTLFLDGRVKLDEFLEVEDGEFQGTYQIVSIKHKLDYEGNMWTTYLECQREGYKSE
jgi:hypothetical protein